MKENKNLFLLLIVVLLIVESTSLAIAGDDSSMKGGRVFVVRQVPLEFLGGQSPLEDAELSLIFFKGTPAETTVTRCQLNMSDAAVFPNAERFAYDSFPEPNLQDFFVVEARAKVVVGKNDLIQTFGVGSDDGFLLEIEGGEFLTSAEVEPNCCKYGITSHAGNKLSFDGFRPYAESYGVFKFENPGVYEVRLVFVEWAFGALFNFLNAPGDQLDGFGFTILPTDLFPEPLSLVNDPNDKNGIRLLPPNAGE